MAYKFRYKQLGQGPAKPVVDSTGTKDPNGLARDELGFTHPNLHRRIEAQDRKLPEEMPRQYEFGIYGTDSHQVRKKIFHDEESREHHKDTPKDISEIP